MLSGAEASRGAKHYREKILYPVEPVLAEAGGIGMPIPYITLPIPSSDHYTPREEPSAHEKSYILYFHSLY